MRNLHLTFDRMYYSQCKVKISQNFVAFSEYMNFIFHVDHLQTFAIKDYTFFLGIYMPEEGTQKAVAVKRLNEMNQNQLKIFEREANNMRELDHHCIVRLIGIAPQPPTMVLELVCLGKAILI